MSTHLCESLDEASDIRHGECIQLLIDRGADINSKLIFAQSPLHRATRYNHIDCIQILIDNGADKDIKIATIMEVLMP